MFWKYKTYSLEKVFKKKSFDKNLNHTEKYQLIYKTIWLVSI